MEPILKKLEDDEYFKIKAVSSHNVMSFFFPQKYPDQDPKFFQEGTYVHAKTLESPEDAEKIVASRCQKLEKSDKDRLDKMVLKMSDDESFVQKIPALLAYKNQPPFHTPEVLTEVAGFAEYVNKKGIVLPLKGKFDLINTKDKFVLDVKTTSSLAMFETSIMKFAYQIQAAFYLKLANQIHRTTDYKDFYWAVIDKKTLETRMIRCSDDLIENGNYFIDLYLENPPTWLPY